MLPKTSIDNYGKVSFIEGDYGLFLVDSIRPSNNTQNLNLPSSRQCVGTNRLWGANLGKAAYIDLSSKKIAKKYLTDIAVLSRSFLVIEDHIKDEHISKSTSDYCNQWLDNISNELQKLYQQVGEDFETHLSLCQRASQAHKNRIWSKGLVDSYHSSIEKCLVFFMPYRLKCFAEDCANYLERISFLECFFFCCQLLDDFYDIDEDTKKKTNHNMFLENVPERYWQSLNTHKANLLSSLLLLLKRNLTSPRNIKLAEGNKILEYYLEAGNWWLNQKLSYVSDIPIPQIAELEFKKFLFDESCVLALFDHSNNNLVSYSLEDIRPELFQTAYMGKKYIHDV